MSDDEKVGFGRPPRRTRYRPGESGNPKGRRRKSRNIVTALAAVLDEVVSVRESGREIRLTKGQALAKMLVSRALSGDMRAMAQLIALVPDRFRLPPGEIQTQPVSPAEAEMLERFVARQLRLATSQPSVPSSVVSASNPDPKTKENEND